MLERRVAAGHDTFPQTHAHTLTPSMESHQSHLDERLTYSSCPESVYNIAGGRAVIKLFSKSYAKYHDRDTHRQKTS